MPVTDLNPKTLISYPPGSSKGGTTDVYRQNHFLPDHRSPAHAYLPTVRSAISWTLQSTTLLLSGSISLHGFCPVDLQRKSSGYRGLPACSRVKIVSYGNPCKGLTKHTGRCQRETGLAYLRRSCPSIDSYRSSSLPPRRLRRGDRSDGSVIFFV